MLALTAQVVLCLSVAPALAAKLTSDADTQQKDPNPKPEAAFQAARDAANIRPEEVNDREHHARGLQPPGLRHVRARHSPQTREAGGRSNLPDNINLPQDWVAPWQWECPLLPALHPDASFLARLEVGTFLQPTGPPISR